MENLQASEMTDLHAAGFAVGQNDLWSYTIDCLFQILADFLRNLILLLLKTKSSAIRNNLLRCYPVESPGPIGGSQRQGDRFQRPSNDMEQNRRPSEGLPLN